MTTEEAFKHLTDQRGWYKQAGIPAGTAQSLKRHFNNGLVRPDHMSKLLKAAGYTEIPAQWKPSEDPK